jgi:hypothetical protein
VIGNFEFEPKEVTCGRKEIEVRLAAAGGAAGGWQHVLSEVEAHCLWLLVLCG